MRPLNSIKRRILYAFVTGVLLNPLAAHAGAWNEFLSFLGIAAKDATPAATKEGADQGATAAGEDVSNIITGERPTITDKQRVAALAFTAALTGENGTGALFSDIDNKVIGGLLPESYGRVGDIDNTVVGLLQGDVAMAGEAGVGKTQTVVGLAERIRNGHIPPELANAHILEVNMEDEMAQDIGSFSRQVTKAMDIVTTDLRKRGVAEPDKTPVIFYFSRLNAVEEGRDLDRYISAVRQQSNGRAHIILEGVRDQLDQLEKTSAYIKLFYSVNLKSFTSAQVFAIVREAAAAKKTIVDNDVLEFINLSAQRFNARMGSPLAQIRLFEGAVATKAMMRYRTESALAKKIEAEIDEHQRLIDKASKLFASDEKGNALVDEKGAPALRAYAQEIIDDQPLRIQALRDQLKKVNDEFQEQLKIQTKLKDLMAQSEAARGNQTRMNELASQILEIRKRLSTLTREDVALQIQLQNPDVSMEEILGLRAATTIAERRAAYDKLLYSQPGMREVAMKGRNLLDGDATKEGDGCLWSALVLGGSGVGKTEAGKTGGIVDFGGRYEIIDMGNFVDKTAVTAGAGAGKGFKDSDKGSDFVNAARRLLQGFLIFDEIEKAFRINPEMQGPMLAMIDKGVMKDAQGNIGDFKRIFVWMTSNAIRSLTPQQRVIYLSLDAKAKKEFLIQLLLNKSAIGVEFWPEFLRRIDDIILADDLDQTGQLRIIGKIMTNFQAKTLERRTIRLVVTPRARKAMVHEVSESTGGTGRDVPTVFDERIRNVWITARDQGVYVGKDGTPHNLDLAEGDGYYWLVDYTEEAGYTHRILRTKAEAKPILEAVAKDNEALEKELAEADAAKKAAAEQAAREYRAALEAHAQAAHAAAQAETTAPAEVPSGTTPPGTAP